MNFLRKRLRRASVGGRWFYLNDTNIDSGRRLSRFEFPFQEKAIVQDMGRQGQIICVAGFVAGANYRSDADNLLKECEKQGPIEFFHPYYGRRQVVCKSCRMNENNIEGGIIYFSFQFYETVDTAAAAFGLQNLPLVGVLGGADVLASASKMLTDTIDSANEIVGYADQLTDSILMCTEIFEKIFSPILHTEDSLNNLALAINDMRQSVAKDYSLGTAGMITAFNNVLAVIAGARLDDTDPYHWTHEFPPERGGPWYPWYPFWPIVLGINGIIIGMQATHVFTRLKNYPLKRQLEELRSLKANIDAILSDAEAKPNLYRPLKDLQSFVISQLFSEPLASVTDDTEKTSPTKCLILEAYEEKGGLDKMESILNQYRFSSTLAL